MADEKTDPASSALSLTTAASLLAIATVFLPAVGFVAETIRYLPVPSIPVTAAAASQSIASLALFGLAAVWPVLVGLAFVPISRRDAVAFARRQEQFHEFAQNRDRVLARWAEIKTSGIEADEAVSIAAAKGSKLALAKAQQAVEHWKAEAAEFSKELDALDANQREVSTRIRRLLYWAHRHGGTRATTAVTFGIVGGSLLFLAILFLSPILVFPFPESIGSTLGVLIIGWPVLRAIPNKAVTTTQMLPYLAATLLLSTVTIGLGSNPGQAVYVTTTGAGAPPTSWYVRLGDSADPVYLVTCSADRTYMLPSSSIVSVAQFSHTTSWDSLLAILSTGRFQGFGLHPSCPSSPPPP